MFLEMYPFPLGFQFIGTWLFILFSYDFFYLWYFSCNFSSFIFKFCLYGFSLFFTWWDYLKVFYFFFIFSKNWLLVSWIFSILAVLFLYSLVFIVSNLLVNLVFVLSLTLLDGKLIYLRFVFFCWGRHVLLYTSLLELLLQCPSECGNLRFYFHLCRDIFWFLLISSLAHLCFSSISPHVWGFSIFIQVIDF